jgi:hypothetical protein
MALFFVVNPALIVLMSYETYNHGASLYFLAAVSVVLSLVFAVFLCVLPNKIYQIVTALLRSLFLMCFIVSMFYPTSIGLIDGGSSKEISQLEMDTFYTLFTLFVLAAFFFFLRGEDTKRTITNLYIGALIFCAGIVVYQQFLYLTNHDDKKYYSEKTDFRFGSDKNIIVIMADMLQGSTLEQYLLNNPDEQKGFDGFTLFSRATSPFPFTSYGLPVILSGDIYINGAKAQQTDVIEHIKSNSFIRDAVSAGYDKTVVSIDLMDIDRDQYVYKSAETIDTAILLLDLSVLRVFRNLSLSIFSDDRRGLLHLVGYKLVSRDMMNRLAHEKIGPSQNKLIYIHSLVPHVPITFGPADLKETRQRPEPLGLKVENYWNEMNFFMGQVRALVDHMKEIGIYDKSLIIITGDHGHLIGENEDLYKNNKGTEDFAGSTKTVWGRAASMYNAAILVKPPYQSKPMAISRETASTMGIRPLINAYIKATDNPTDVLATFKIGGANKVVLFKDQVKSNPYLESNDHVVCELNGNVATLVTKFLDDRAAEPYEMGTKMEPVINNLDQHWVREEKGAWLKDRKGTVFMRLNSVNPAKSHQMLLDFHALANEKYPSQRVHITINGFDAGIVKSRCLERATYAVNIPAGVLIKSGLNSIEFEPLDAVLPQDIGAFTFASPLSIYLYSFQIVEAPNEGVK